MTHNNRIGQLLSNLVPISKQDVEEILEEQNITRRRFGEIAVSWGLCTPGHVWDAWARQPHDALPLVDLVKLGIDSQAVEHLSREEAEQLGAIPIRAFDALLVLAIKNADDRKAIEQHMAMCKKTLAFVLAEAHQIDQAIATYYAPAPEAH